MIAYQHFYNIAHKTLTRLLLTKRLSYYLGGQVSFSQEGEDILVDRIFKTNYPGFYIDIGAHHPIRFSNTYYFYLKGWKGINIEPNPPAIKIFNQIRERDINLPIAIGKLEKSRKYFIFNEPALNTFVEKEANAKINLGYKLNSKISIETVPLSQVLDKYLPKGQTIDMMNVDVEGLDLEVLKSNNWDKYRPKIIIAESLNSDITTISDDPVSQLLKENGYHLITRCLNSTIYSKITSN